MLSSLGALLRAQTTALVTASLTLVMSSTFCAGTDGTMGMSSSHVKITTQDDKDTVCRYAAGTFCCVDDLEGKDGETPAL